MRTILTTLVALMLNAGAAGATGNKLLAKHRAYEQVAATNLTNDIKVAAEAEACQSYIWGRVDGNISGMFWPDGATYDQVVAITIRHLKENPALLHLPAFVQVEVALLAA